MASRKISLDQLSVVLHNYGEALIAELYRELRLQVGFVLIDELTMLSPVGDAAKDIHPGKYRASHTPSAGKPKPNMLPDTPTAFIPGDPEVEKAFKPAPPGDPVFFANAARTEKYAAKRPGSYAKLLEGGRRRYNRMSKKPVNWKPGDKPLKGMWIGSNQAKKGIYDPATKASIARRATIRRKTVKAVKARLDAIR